MTKLNIKYSLDFEINRIFNTLTKIEWYKEKGYKVILPLDIPTENIGEIDKEYIKDLVLKEYDEESYKYTSDDLFNKLSDINKDFKNKFSDISIKPLDEYEIFITKYGVGGSYNTPNKIIINISLMSKERHVEVIIHEILHLMIEHLIQKYKVSHWKKERIVDLIFLRIFPDLWKEQNLFKKINIKKIDNIFDKYFPNIENIIRTIGEMKEKVNS